MNQTFILFVLRGLPLNRRVDCLFSIHFLHNSRKRSDDTGATYEIRNSTWNLFWLAFRDLAGTDEHALCH
jgi:hypothetical protein